MKLVMESDCWMGKEIAQTIEMKGEAKKGICFTASQDRAGNVVLDLREGLRRRGKKHQTQGLFPKR